MKVMCISDIHGNIECLKKAIEQFTSNIKISYDKKISVEYF